MTAWPDGFTTYTVQGGATDPLSVPDHPAVHAQLKLAAENFEKVIGIMPGAPYGGTSSESIAFMLHNKSRLNYLINGAFTIAARGPGPFTSAGTVYGIDRWINATGGTTISVTQESLAPNTIAEQGAFTRHFFRNVVVAGAGTSDHTAICQRIDGVDTLQGSAATLSFWAKADAPKSLSIEFFQDFGTGGFPSAVIRQIEIQKVTLTSSWAKYILYVSIPPITGKTIGAAADHLGINIWFDAGSALNAFTSSLGHQSGTFDMTMVQLEKGWTPSVFEDEHFAMTQFKCQYYLMPLETRSYTGAPYSTTAVAYGIPLLRTMRAVPTIATTGSLTNAIEIIGAGTATPTAIAINSGSSSGVVLVATGSSGLTVGTPCALATPVLLTAEY